MRGTSSFKTSRREDGGGQGYPSSPPSSLSLFPLSLSDHSSFSSPFSGYSPSPPLPPSSSTTSSSTRDLHPSHPDAPSISQIGTTTSQPHPLSTSASPPPSLDAVERPSSHSKREQRNLSKSTGGERRDSASLSDVSVHSRHGGSRHSIAKNLNNPAVLSSSTYLASTSRTTNASRSASSSSRTGYPESSTNPGKTASRKASSTASGGGGKSSSGGYVSGSRQHSCSSCCRAPFLYSCDLDGLVCVHIGGMLAIPREVPFSVERTSRERRRRRRIPSHAGGRKNSKNEVEDGEDETEKKEEKNDVGREEQKRGRGERDGGSSSLDRRGMREGEQKEEGGGKRSR